MPNYTLVSVNIPSKWLHLCAMKYYYFQLSISVAILCNTLIAQTLHAIISIGIMTYSDRKMHYPYLDRVDSVLRCNEPKQACSPNMAETAPPGSCTPRAPSCKPATAGTPFRQSRCLNSLFHHLSTNVMQQHRRWTTAMSTTPGIGMEPTPATTKMKPYPILKSPNKPKSIDDRAKSRSKIDHRKAH